MAFIRSQDSPAAFLRLMVISTTAFLRFDIAKSHEKEIVLQSETPVQAESEGAFFSSESAEKNRTGWFGQCVTP
ncbi:MAG: hypothetical protein EXR37_03490 [Limnohabitans sp.]|nr:hypothetical protein [Limnohabitans sp.]